MLRPVPETYTCTENSSQAPPTLQQQPGSKPLGTVQALALLLDLLLFFVIKQVSIVTSYSGVIGLILFESFVQVCTYLLNGELCVITLLLTWVDNKGIEDFIYFFVPGTMVFSVVILIHKPF